MEKVFLSFALVGFIVNFIMMIIYGINPFSPVFAFFKREKIIMYKNKSVKNYQYNFDESVPNRPKEIYNTLPKSIKRKFSVMYDHTYEGFENIFIIKSYNGKWGAIKLENGQYTVIAENIYDSTCFYAQYDLIDAVLHYEDTHSDKTLYLLFDTNGRMVKRLEGYDYIRFDFYGNIITSKNRLSGFLDINLEEKAPCKYDGLRAIDKNLFVATENISSRYLIINEKEEIIYECKFPNKVYEEVYNDKIIVEENDKYYSLDLHSKEKTVLPYDKIYRILGYGVNSKIPSRYITIKDYVNHEEEYEETLIYPDHFMVDEGKYGVISADGEVCIPNIYDKIEFLSEKYFRVALGKFSFEIKEKNDDVLASGAKWGIVDIENNLILPVQYTHIVYGHQENRYFSYEDGIMEGRYDHHSCEYWWFVINGKMIELTHL